MPLRVFRRGMDHPLVVRLGVGRVFEVGTVSESQILLYAPELSRSYSHLAKQSLCNGWDFSIADST